MSSEEKKLTFNGQQKSGKNNTWRMREGFETTKQEAGKFPFNVLEKEIILQVQASIIRGEPERI
jgi:hypothetical protein